MKFFLVFISSILASQILSASVPQQTDAERWAKVYNHLPPIREQVLANRYVKVPTLQELAARAVSQVARESDVRVDELCTEDGRVNDNQIAMARVAEFEMGVNTRSHKAFWHCLYRTLFTPEGDLKDSVKTFMANQLWRNQRPHREVTIDDLSDEIICDFVMNMYLSFNKSNLVIGPKPKNFYRKGNVLFHLCGQIFRYGMLQYYLHDSTWHNSNEFHTLFFDETQVILELANADNLGDIVPEGVLSAFKVGDEGRDGEICTNWHYMQLCPFVLSNSLFLYNQPLNRFPYVHFFQNNGLGHFEDGFSITAELPREFLSVARGLRTLEYNTPIEEKDMAFIIACPHLETLVIEDGYADENSWHDFSKVRLTGEKHFKLFISANQKIETVKLPKSVRHLTLDMNGIELNAPTLFPDTKEYLKFARELRAIDGLEILVINDKTYERPYEVLDLEIARIASCIETDAGVGSDDPKLDEYGSNQAGPSSAPKREAPKQEHGDDTEKVVPSTKRTKNLGHPDYQEPQEEGTSSSVRPRDNESDSDDEDSDDEELGGDVSSSKRRKNLGHRGYQG